MPRCDLKSSGFQHDYKYYFIYVSIISMTLKLIAPYKMSIIFPTVSLRFRGKTTKMVAYVHLYVIRKYIMNSLTFAFAMKVESEYFKSNLV